MQTRKTSKGIKGVSRREVLRRSIALANKLDQVVRVSILLGAELYSVDPKNTIFTNGTLTDDSLRRIRKIARMKKAVDGTAGADDSRIDKVSRVGWLRRFWWAIKSAFKG